MNATAWREEIKEAKIKGVFEYTVSESAEDWGCCAVGTKFTIKQRTNLEPEHWNYKDAQKYLTFQAYLLGTKFSKLVDNDQVDKAEKVFNEIRKLKHIIKPMYRYRFSEVGA
jgi:hypothetical protein